MTAVLYNCLFWAENACFWSPPHKRGVLSWLCSGAVAGVAALIRSQYPKLTAPQVKQIIMESGLTPRANVILAGDSAKTGKLEEISKAGTMVNAYNALIMAHNVSSGKIKL